VAADVSISVSQAYVQHPAIRVLLPSEIGFPLNHRLTARTPSPQPLHGGAADDGGVLSGRYSFLGWIIEMCSASCP
jgi:hypothetical protein